MIGIIERLRALAKDYHQHRPHYTEAADEIERLRERIRQLTFTLDQQMGTPCEQIRHEHEIERLRTENWQLRQACGYPIPGDKETPQNPFKCGMCDARAQDEAVALREATGLLESFVAEHFPSNADWKPQPDLLGMIFQLSNAVTIARDYKAKMGHYKAEIERLQRALEIVMVGGNHLAVVLIGHLGGGFASDYPPDLDHSLALECIGPGDTYETWCCWNAIMSAREAIAAQDQPATGK